MTKDVLKMHAKSLIDMFKDQKALYGAEMARVLEPKTAIILGGLGQKKASAASAIPGHDKGSPGRKVTSNPPPPSAYGAHAHALSLHGLFPADAHALSFCVLFLTRARALCLSMAFSRCLCRPPPPRL
jgi:hypothetical protein